MQKWIVALLFVALASGATAQTTNAFTTAIETFEAQTNTILIKAYGQVGTASVSSQTVAIYCKETSDISHGGKVYGMAVELPDVEPHQICFVDEDEITALVNALDYLSRISNKVTALPSFDAQFTTRSGLRFGAHSARKQAAVVYYFEMNGSGRIPLTNVQLSQIADLMAQTQKAINGLKQPQ